MPRIKVFISYSHRDLRWLDELRTQLEGLGAQLDVWDDTRLVPGKRWLPQIQAALAEARVAVLLVSPDFLKSRFITEHEVPVLLAAAESAGVPLLCAFVRPSVVERREYTYVDASSGRRVTATLPEFQGLNDPQRALSELSKPKRERELVALARKILEAAQAPKDNAVDLRPYLEKLRDQTHRLELHGIGDAQARRVELERIYTRLRVAPPADGGPAGLGGRRAAQARAEIAGEREAPQVELKDLLGRHPHLVLVGDPGAGKTTFLRFVALNLARAWLDDERAACLERLGLTGDAPFPVLVSLGGFGQFLAAQASPDFPPESAEQFYLHLDFLARGYPQELPAGFLRQRVRAGGCLLLLDGLDEVPGEATRRSVGAILEEVLAEGRRCGNRHVATCRTRAYQGRAQLGPEFVRADLLDFGPEEIETFVTQWSRALYAANDADSDQAAAHGQALLAAMRAHPHVQPLSTSPLLLTILAVVHWNLRRLPEGRAELYKVALDHLLRSRERHSNYKLMERREGLREIARCMFVDAQGVRKSLDRREAALAVGPVLGVDDGKAAAFVEDEELHSGILVSRAEGEVEFWHPTFAEYLAAEAFAAERECWQHVGAHVFDPRWNEVVLLLAGCLRGHGPRLAAGFIKQILETDTSLAGRARAVGLVGRILRDLLPYGGDPTRDTGYVEALREMPAIFKPGSQVPEAVRVDVGEALGQAGDPRLHDDDHANRVFIRGGTFMMGSEEQQGGIYRDLSKDERPFHRVTISGFWLDRYPVTVAQYRRFVEAGAEGYLDSRFWCSQGWRVREQRALREPRRWEDQLRHPNRPVTRVSWYEADAYCAWLSARSGRCVSLPTEAQWEYAARGASGRKYPWGDDEPTDRHLNFRVNVGVATPVGIYPLGATPEDVRDLAGNVWEWCLDWYGAYEASEQTDPIGPPNGDRRVLRGGGFRSYPIRCRAAYRGSVGPGDDNDVVGFRCVWLGSGGQLD